MATKRTFYLEASMGQGVDEGGFRIPTVSPAAHAPMPSGKQRQSPLRHITVGCLRFVSKEKGSGDGKGGK